MSDAAVARSARYGAAKGCRVSFFMVFVRFLCETQPNRCRVFCRVSMGYYGFSLLVDLLHAVARASSYGLKTLKTLSAGATQGHRTY